MWYVAHIGVSFREKDRLEAPIVVEESMILIDARNEEEAISKGKKVAASYASTNISYHDPHSSIIESLGVLRLISISNPGLDNQLPPSDGTELTYEIFNFKDEAALQRYRKREALHATYWEDEPRVKSKR